MDLSNGLYCPTFKPEKSVNTIKIDDNDDDY